MSKFNRISKKMHEGWREDNEVMLIMYACGLSERLISFAFERECHNVRRVLAKSAVSMQRHKTGAWVHPQERML